MYKVIVIGHFDWKNNNMIGAVVKARSIYRQLCITYNDKTIGFVDIYNWRKNIPTVFFAIAKSFFETHNIVLVMSDTKKILMYYFTFLSYLTKAKVMFCVVGSNIDSTLSQFPDRIKTLNFVDSFLVETKLCLKNLKSLGIENVHIMRNFKQLEIIENREIIKTYKFCTFSRVTGKKGIIDAIQAIDELNNIGYKCSLDIYGMIDKNFETMFWSNINSSKHVKYCGVVNATDATKIVSLYYCLLFPTRFYDEGIPGTILDAFASQTPIICSNWKYCNEIIIDGVNGLVYPFKDFNGLKEKIKFAIDNPVALSKIGTNGLKTYSSFIPENAIKSLLLELDF